MKRDLDLVRTLLLLSEEIGLQKRYFDPQIEGYTAEEISYHLELLQQANLAEIQRIPTGTKDYWRLGNLTWDGQDFLTDARNDTAWNRTKEIVRARAGSASFEVVKATLAEVAKSLLLGK